MVVNHSKKQYVHDSAYVNGCENRNQLINENPSEKCPNFSLWDELHGGNDIKRRQSFCSSTRGKPRHLWRGRGIVYSTQC